MLVCVDEAEHLTAPPPIVAATGRLSLTEASAAGKRKRPADENVDDGFKAPKVQGGGEDERARAMRLMMEDDEPVRWLRHVYLGQ